MSFCVSKCSIRWKKNGFIHTFLLRYKRFLGIFASRRFFLLDTSSPGRTVFFLVDTKLCTCSHSSCWIVKTAWWWRSYLIVFSRESQSKRKTLFIFFPEYLLVRSNVLPTAVMPKTSQETHRPFGKINIFPKFLMATLQLICGREYFTNLIFTIRCGCY